MRTSVIKHKELLEDLVKIQAHLGPLHQSPHNSQYPFSLGIRNQFCIYDLEKSLLALKRAIRVLKRPLLIVGCPKGQENYCQTLFNSYSNIRFYTNWQPGLLTKNRSKGEVIVIYDINENRFARLEALQTQNPIVAFVGPSCDIQGIDYPIPLSFHGIIGSVYYNKLWEAILNKRRKV